MPIETLNEMNRIFVLFLILFFSGCKTMEKPPFPEIDDYAFETTIETDSRFGETESAALSVRFQGTPLPHAMQLLTDLTGKTIIWGQNLDTMIVDGSFIDLSLATILDSVARRCNASVTEVGEVWFIGEARREDLVTAVVRSLPVERTELLASLSSYKSSEGSITIIGSSIVISDRLDATRKMIDSIEILRKRLEHSYMAEVFFVRVKEDDFLRLTGDLQIQQIDVFASGVNIENMFRMFIDGDAGAGFTQIEQRPVLYLSEGRKATFEVGSEIVKEKKTVSENGVIQTSGYETFNDGLTLSLMLQRISEKNYSVDFDLTVSTFESTKDKDSIPTLDRSVLTSPGLLVQDSQVYYIGSLKRKDARKLFGLFSIETGKNNDVLTIWFRVRELKK